MAIKYDASIIETFAARLYAQADRIVRVYGFSGLVLGGIVTSAASLVGRQVGGSELLIGGVIGAVIGAAIGRSRGFALRLQAQMALCQVQIERNSRGASVEAVRVVNESADNPLFSVSEKHLDV